MIEVMYRARWLTAIAVVFSALGALLMLVVGAVSTTQSIGIYLGADDADAFSDEAAIEATVKLVSSIDKFLVALVLLVFAYGVFKLFIADPERDDIPNWFNIHSVTDLKIRLLETITSLLAVLFLEGALNVGAENLEWSSLVVPISVGIFAASIWVFHHAH
ncbi:MAG: YqhA family protein [Acidimicrobiales bacterium]